MLDLHIIVAFHQAFMKDTAAFGATELKMIATKES